MDDIPRSKLYYIPDINKPDSFLIGYFHVIDSIVFYRKHEIGPDMFAEGLCEVCELYETDNPLYDFSLQKGDILDLEICSEHRKVTSVEQAGRVRRIESKKNNF